MVDLPRKLLLLFYVLFLATLSVASSAFDQTKIGQNHGQVVWRVRSSNAEGAEAGQPLDEMSVGLAESRTERRDVLEGFKYYKGGWNISNEHYLASAGFTGAPLFVIAVVWFLGFGFCLVFLCCYHCCCKQREYGYSQTAYALSLIALVLFTTAAIVGCIVLYTGQGKFHNSTTDALSFVVGISNSTVDHLCTVSAILGAAKETGVGVFVLPQNVQNNIASVDNKIKNSSEKLEYDTQNNSEDIKRILDAVRLALIILSAVMLCLAILGFSLSLLGLQFLVNILGIIGWILIALTFVLCGIFIILQNVVTDTCVAMDEWAKHPIAHTALDDILTCVDYGTAQDTLYQSKDVTYQLITMINQFITNVSNIDFPPISAPLYYNQSGPVVPILCNPFNPDKSNRSCSAHELSFIAAPQERSRYICQVSQEGLCTTVGRLTPSLYNQITKAANVSYSLNQYTPFLINLQDCTFVRDTFSIIYKDHCPGLMQFSKLVYIGLAIISSSVMLSLLLWLIHARERRHRAYSNLLIAGSASQESSSHQKQAQ